MGYLAKELGRNRAVEDEIAVEELNLFDGLPPPDWCRARRGCWKPGVVVILGVRMRIRFIGIALAQYRRCVIVELILVMWSGIGI